MSLFKRISSKSLLFQIIIFTLLILLVKQFLDDNVGLISFVIFYGITLLLRNVIPRSHRSGIKNVKHLKYDLAIQNFTDSYAFFNKYNWLDKYRFFTLLSPSKVSYKEIALVNIAFCYSQVEKGDKALEFYQKALNEFPESYIAQAGLNMLNSVKSI